MRKTDETARDLAALVSRLRRRLREVAGFDGLTPSQTSVLSRLDRCGASTTSDLARLERVRPQSMATTVAALEARGLVTRVPDEHDGRRQLIRLTVETDAFIKLSRQNRSAWLAQLLDERLDAAQRRTVAEAVAILMKAIDE